MTTVTPVNDILQNFAVTLENFKKNIMGDSIKRSNGFVAQIIADGNYKIENGGDPIVREVLIKESENGQFVKGLEELKNKQSDGIRDAKYEWAEYYDRVVISNRALLLNSGNNVQKKNLAKALIRQVESSVKNVVSKSIWEKDVNPLIAAKQITTIPEIVSDTSGVIVGGLNPTDYPLWDNQRATATGALVSGAVNGKALLDNMELLYSTIEAKSGDAPNIIIANSKVRTAYARACQELKRYDASAKVKADIGYSGYEFNQAFFILDGNCPDDKVYMLNTRDLEMIFHPDAYFSLDKDLKTYESHAGKYATHMTMYSLVCLNRKSQGVLTLTEEAE